MSASIDDLVHRRPAKIDRPPCTATITGVLEDGVYAVPLDGDNRDPIGPCYGLSAADTAAVGTLVLLVFTSGGPWIAATHGGA